MTNPGSKSEPVIDPISGKLGAEPSVIVKPRSKVPQQTIVTMVILGVSAGAIFGMRKLGMQAGIAFGDQKIDYTPPDSEKARTYERIMGDLSRIQTPLDVALGEFGNSPFMLKQDVPATPGLETPKGPTPEQAAADEAKRKAEQRLADLQDKASKIKLQGVMGGSRPLARIDGETVRVGDKIGEDFVVRKIEGRQVVLTAEKKEFVLELDMTPQGPKTAPVKMGKGTKK